MTNMRQTPFLAPFLMQLQALGTWLESALSEAGITGAPSRRARTRINEFEDEVREVFCLIGMASPVAEIAKLTTYTDFDANKLFDAKLAYRSDSGIQDLGSAIQDELAGIARHRKKELEESIPKDKTPDVDTMETWRAMSACDYIEEVGSTVMRLAESARYLFLTEFLYVASRSGARLTDTTGATTSATVQPPQTSSPPKDANA